MKGFSFIKKLLFLFIIGVGIVSLSSYSTYMDYSIDDSISSTDSPQQAPPTTLSSGTTGGYNFVKPFDFGSDMAVASYIGSDGYLYAGGDTWGNSTYYKQTNAGTGIVDYDLSNNYGIMVNSSGTVKVAAANANTSTTWSTVTVGGSTTTGKAVATGSAYQMVLNTSDVLYTSTNGATTMTSVVSSSTTSAARGGIVDFAMGRSYQFVLYGNGDLYRGTAGALEASMTKVASNVLMFDCRDYSQNVYIYNSSNQIQYGTTSNTSLSATSGWTTLVTVADVVQIRGGYHSSGYYSGWGYLTSNGTLTTMEGTKHSTAYTGNNHTRIVTGVDYFDVDGHRGTWGYLKDGKMYFWYGGYASNGNNVTTNTSPTVVSGTYATNNSFDIADLAGTDRDLQNTPPA